MTRDYRDLPLGDGKIASSKIPPLHLIPTVALERIAERFQTGVDRKGDKAWNATTPNQEALLDLDLLLDRIGHGIRHLLLLRDKVVAMRNDAEPLNLEDDDAAAAAWAGVYAICAVDAIVNSRGRPNP